MNKKIIVVVLLVVSMAKGVDFTGQSDAELIAKSAELAALQASRLSLLASLESAKGILKAFEESSGMVIQGVRAVFKAASSMLQIKSMKAHVAPRELVEGKLPNVQLEVVVFGKTQTLSGLIFDFQHPQKSLEALVNKLGDLLNIS